MEMDDANDMPTKATPFLDCFWNMASTESKERSFAAASLGTHVSLEADDETKATNHVYAIKRLIRGVCSSRGGARQGFSTALTMVLTTAADEGNDNLVAEVLDRLLEETEPTGGMRGAEERDLFVGRLFGLASCARRSFKSVSTGSNSTIEATRKYNASTSKEAVRILALLIESYHKRKWMREACVSSFRDLLNNSTTDLVIEKLLPLLAPLLQERQFSSYSADEFALALIVEKCFYSLMNEEGKKEEEMTKCVALFPSYLHPFKIDSPKKAKKSAKKGKKKNAESSDGDSDSSDDEEEEGEFEFKSMLHPDNVSKIAEPVKLATQCFPHIHLSWQLILNNLVSVKGEMNMVQFESCWPVIESSLIGGGTHTMKGTLLMILPMFVDKLSSDHVKAIFTTKVLRLILNSTSKKDNVLYGQAKQVLNEITCLHAEDSAWRFQVACCLMSAQADEVSNFNFDTRTNTKTVATLLAQLDEKSRNDYFTMLENSIFQPINQDGNNFRQLSAVSSLYTAVRSALVIPTSDTSKDVKANAKVVENSSEHFWQRRVMVFLMGVAFFDVSSLLAQDKSTSAPKSAKKTRKGRSASMDETTPLSSGSSNPTDVAVERLILAIKNNENNSELHSEVRKLAASRFYSLLADQSSNNSGAGGGGGVCTMIEWLGFAHEAWFTLETKYKCSLFSQLDKEASEELEALRSLCGPATSDTSVSTTSKKPKRKSSMDSNDGTTSNDTGFSKTAMEVLASQSSGANTDVNVKRNQAFLVLLRSSSLLLLKASEPSETNQEEENEEGEEEDVERGDIVSLLSSLRECYSDMSQSKAPPSKKSSKKKQIEDEEEEEASQSLAIVAASSLSLLDVVSSSKDSMAVRGIRDCIKRSFGLILSCEEDLDTMTINTIISAVCGDDVEEEEEEEDDEEMSDEEVMVAEVDEEDEDEEDDEEDDEDEEEEDEKSSENKEIMNRIQNMSSQPDGDVMLSDTADLAAILLNEDEDEEQRAKRQQALENMLAARRLAKPTKAMKMQELRAKCQRRLRALDLLEQVAKIHPNSPHLLAAVLPLINAVRELQEEGASSDAAVARSHNLPSEAKDLKQRLTNFLKNKLFKKCHPKPLSNASEEELLAFRLSSKYTVNGLLSFLKMKCGGGDIRNTLSELCMAALSTSLYGLTLSTESGEDQVLEMLPVYKEEVEMKENVDDEKAKKGKKEEEDEEDDEEEEEEEEEYSERSVALNIQTLFNRYMSHKTQKTAIDRLGVAFFIELFKHHKELMLSAILPDLSNCVFNAKSAFLKSEALKLCLFLFTNKEMKALSQSVLISADDSDESFENKKNQGKKNAKSKKADTEEEDEDDVLIVQTMEKVSLEVVNGACAWLETFSTSPNSTDIKPAAAGTTSNTSKQQQKVLRPLLEALVALFTWHPNMSGKVTANVNSRLLACLQHVSENSMAQAIHQYCRKLTNFLEGNTETESSSQTKSAKKSRKSSALEEEKSEESNIDKSSQGNKKSSSSETPSKQSKKQKQSDEATSSAMKKRPLKKVGGEKTSEVNDEKVKKTKTPKKVKK